MPKDALKLLLAAPRGFCAGVDRAIQIVERALERYGAPVYVRHEIVHNRHVVEGLERKGAVFVEELDEIPGKSPVVFSAHGVPKSVPAEARAAQAALSRRHLPAGQQGASRGQVHFDGGRHIILIGHAGHPEVIGTMGQLPPGAVTLVETADDAERRSRSRTTGDRLAYITQTTLSLDDTIGIVEVLRRRFPEITGRARKTSATPPPTARRR